MTEREHKALRDYCAMLLREYGFHFQTTDPIIPALYLIHKEHQLTNSRNEELSLVVKQAAASIQPKAFHFDSPDAAFSFQVGIAVRWIIILLIVLMTTGAIFLCWPVTSKENTSARPDDEQILLNGLVQQIQKDKTGMRFIDFTASKSDSVQYFKEYRKINKSTVRIFLGKPSSIKSQK